MKWHSRTVFLYTGVCWLVQFVLCLTFRSYCSLQFTKFTSALCLIVLRFLVFMLWKKACYSWLNKQNLYLNIYSVLIFVLRVNTIHVNWTEHKIDNSVIIYSIYSCRSSCIRCYTDAAKVIKSKKDIKTTNFCKSNTHSLYSKSIYLMSYKSFVWATIHPLIPLCSSEMSFGLLHIKTFVNLIWVHNKTSAICCHWCKTRHERSHILTYKVWGTVWELLCTVNII